MYWIYFQDFLACMHLIQLVKGLVIIWQVQSGVQGKKEKKKLQWSVYLPLGLGVE